MSEDEAIGRAAGLTQAAEAKKSRGDFAGALAAWTERASLLRRLLGAADDPGLADELAATLDRMGDVLLARGELEPALAGCRESLEIRRALAAAEPGSRERQREAARAAERLARVVLAKSALAPGAGARAGSGDDGRPPAARQGDMAWRLGAAGDALAAQGDLGGALALFRACVALRRTLAAQQPDNRTLAHDLAWRLGTIGEALARQGDTEGAIAAQREALIIRRELAAAAPANAGAARDLAWNLGALATLLAPACPDEALTLHGEHLALMRHLRQSEPDSRGARLETIATLNRMGELTMARGGAARAREYFAEALALRRALAADEPANPGCARDVAWSLGLLAGALAREGDVAGALAAHRECLAIRLRLLAADPANAGLKADIALTNEHIEGLIRQRENDQTA